MLSDVQLYAENWQRALRESLPNAFVAYNGESMERERAVTYALGAEALELLREQSKPKKKLRYVIYLGLTGAIGNGELPNYPVFTLFLLATHEGQEPNYDQAHELAWDPSSRFANIDPNDPDSQTNAIPAASAYLFIHAYLETAESYLGNLFMGVAGYEGKRVKAYTFSNAESQTIFADIKSSLEGDSPGLAVHLGRGMATTGHPFEFRPVLEVGACVAGGGTYATGRDSTGLMNDCGDSFFDYSIPDPPGE